MAGILGVSVAELNEKYWHINHFYVPAACAVFVSLYVLYAVKESPKNEGLIEIEKINELRWGGGNEEIKIAQKTDLSSFQIFYRYVFKNKNAWYVALMEAFVYMVRFGLISWLPIYLLKTKGFTKEQMSVAFLLFEWAAIPSTLFAGYISDKIFRGLRMPPAIFAMVIIFFMIIGYFASNNLYLVIFFAAIAGCLIYVPQFLIGVQSMDVVPAFAVGSCVGLRGFMSYVVGASLGTKAIGWAVDYYKSWNAGLIMLLSACVLCVFFSILSHLGAKKLQKS